MTALRRSDPSVSSSLSDKLIRRGSRRAALTWVAVLVLLFVGVPAAQAHQFTPGYLEIKALADGTAEIVWKVPLIRGRRMNITPALPVSCQTLTPLATYALSNAVLERWTVDCGAAGLAGQPITIEGLEKTSTDVLVRLQFADGRTSTTRLSPDEPDILDSQALAYWLLGDQDKARQDLDRARQIEPSFPSWQDRFHEFEGMF